MGITNSSGIKNSINNRQINQVEKNDVEERRFSFMLGEKIIIKVVVFFGGGGVTSLEQINNPGGRGLLESIIAGYVPLASQNPYPIIVYL